MATPPSGKKEKHPVPDPAQWMMEHAGQTVNGPAGAAPNTPQRGNKPMTPGMSGSTAESGPTKSSGAPQGFGGGPKKKEPQGNKAQAGHKKGGKFGLAPNNKSKAKTMVEGKHPNLPSRNAMVRRLHPNFSPGGGAVPNNNQPARSGLLSKFEGFTPAPQ